MTLKELLTTMPHDPAQLPEFLTQLTAKMHEVSEHKALASRLVAEKKLEVIHSLRADEFYIKCTADEKKELRDAELAEVKYKEELYDKALKACEVAKTSAQSIIKLRTEEMRLSA